MSTDHVVANVSDWRVRSPLHVVTDAEVLVTQKVKKAAAARYADTIFQPPPTVNVHPAIQDLVMADIAIRKDQGIAKYGTALQPWNGRDAVVDAYQEALDLCQYLRQVLYERDGR